MHILYLGIQYVFVFVLLTGLGISCDLEFTASISSKTTCSQPTERLDEVMTLYKQIENLPRNFDLTEEDSTYIKKTLEAALTRPDCPLSHFRVACTIIINGNPYTGVNNEDPTMSNAACGERSTIWGAQSLAGSAGTRTQITNSYVFAINPNTNLVETGISSSCGLCRQTYANRGNAQIIFTYHNRLLKMSAVELLPDPYLFLPEHIIEKKPLKDFNLQLEAILNLPRQGVGEITPQIKEVFREAIIASHSAYAPYHPIREGAAVLYESKLFINGYKIFNMGNYQNASYGASQPAVSRLFPYVKFELYKLANHGDEKSEQSIPKILALFAFDQADNLVSDVSPSGVDRQVAVEEPGGLDTVCYYIYEGILKCKTMQELLPLPFTFISVVGNSTVPK